MAIAMASVGGAGFLHYNMTQEEQIANLKAVKAHRLGYVTRPEVVSPDATLEFLDELATRRGFTSACVTDTGAVGGKLLGLVTSRDAELVADRSTKVVDVMTSASDLLVGSATDDVAALEELLLKSKKGKMPVVNAERMAPSTRNGETKSRRDQTAPVCANVTSHFVEELSFWTAAGMASLSEPAASEPRTVTRAARRSGGRERLGPLVR